MVFHEDADDMFMLFCFYFGFLPSVDAIHRGVLITSSEKTKTRCLVFLICVPEIGLLEIFRLGVGTAALLSTYPRVPMVYCGLTRPVVLSRCIVQQHVFGFLAWGSCCFFKNFRAIGIRVYDLHRLEHLKALFLESCRTAFSSTWL